jgi:hypothetical protein
MVLKNQPVGMTEEVVTDRDIIHVAIAPPDRIEESLIKKVAAIIGKDLYGTRLLLAGKLPKIIADYDDMPVAEQVVQNLRALGLVVLVCKDSELRKPLYSYRALSVQFEEQTVLFHDKDGQEKRLRIADVFLILRGKIQTFQEAEVTRTRMKFSLPATLLTGGIPIWRRVQEESKDRSFQSECFVRLYDRMSMEPVVEVFQHSLDYAFLGDRKGFTSLTNFNIFVAKIRELFSQAIFDDRLVELSGGDMLSSISNDKIEISFRLLHLYYRAMNNLG